MRNNGNAKKQITKAIRKFSKTKNMIIKFINVHVMPNLILAGLLGVHPQAVPPKNEIITPP